LGPLVSSCGTPAWLRTTTWSTPNWGVGGSYARY
jgi:hypothetical protein